MEILGTINEVRSSRKEGMSHYNMLCPTVPGGPIGASFIAPEGKYKIGDTVYDDETASKVYTGTWNKNGKGVCY